jgi:TonB family protein
MYFRSNGISMPCRRTLFRLNPVILTFCLLTLAFGATAQKDTKPVHVSEIEARQRIKYRVDPEYPATARQFRIGGEVVAVITIGADGKVESIDGVKGVQILTAPVVAALRKWIFSPFIQDGMPIRVQTSITILFKL